VRLVLFAASQGLAQLEAVTDIWVSFDKPGGPQQHVIAVLELDLLPLSYPFVWGGAPLSSEELGDHKVWRNQLATTVSAREGIAEAECGQVQ
jgi:hypothetical protein